MDIDIEEYNHKRFAFNRLIKKISMIRLQSPKIFKRSPEFIRIKINKVLCSIFELVVNYCQFSHLPWLLSLASKVFFGFQMCRIFISYAFLHSRTHWPADSLTQTLPSGSHETEGSGNSTFHFWLPIPTIDSYYFSLFSTDTP